MSVFCRWCGAAFPTFRERAEHEREHARRAFVLAPSRAAPVQRRRARSTGTMVAVWRAADFGLDPDEGLWVTVCEDHGGVMHHPTRALAVSWAAEPDGWCPVCMGEEETVR